LDFYCPQARLAVEVDGQQHAEPGAIAHDLERDGWLLRERGVRVLRFSSGQVLGDRDAVRRAIFDALWLESR
jgi:very-short-patch-repair endonuclease